MYGAFRGKLFSYERQVISQVLVIDFGNLTIFDKHIVASERANLILPTKNIVRPNESRESLTIFWASNAFPARTALMEITIMHIEIIKIRLFCSHVIVQ
jgi:hypothetical protein